jgi:hypothetical protein
MDNLVNGRIEELIYLGDHIRVRMNVAGNDEFIVKVRNRGEKRKLAVGETVKIGWAAGMTARRSTLLLKSQGGRVSGRQRDRRKKTVQS